MLTAVPAVAHAEAVEDREDIVVTGERFVRSVQETASSVDVTTGEDLRDRAGADTVREVLAFAPNVMLTGSQNSGPTIRGQNSTGTLSGADAFLGGSRPRTTILLDGRPLSFNEFIFGETGAWDIDQIEVFLGPQTTTQGPNSVAGLINVRTNDPTYGVEGAVRGIIANYDTWQVSGMLNVPLVENQLALRIAADHREHDSFLILGQRPDIGADISEDNFTSFRAKLLVEPENLPGFRGVLTYQFADSTGPQTEQILVPPPGNDERVYPPFDAPVFATKTHTIIADVSQQLTSELVLSNRFTYTKADIKRFSQPGQGVADIDRDEFTNETLLTYGEASDRISGVAGVYYQGASADEFIDLAGFGLGEGIFVDKTESIGVFGEVTFAPVPRLFLTAGLRYQRDNQDREGGFAAPFLDPLDYNRTFDALLPKFGIAYDVNPDLRVGFQAQRGFNAGGVTLSFYTGAVDRFEDERLWNYEFYWRSSILDGRLTLNGNIFYTDFEDIQRPVFVLLPQPFIELSNAEDAHSYGAEVQLSYELSERLSFDLGIGLLETKIKTVSEEPALEGNEFERSPGFTASLGARVEPIDDLTLSVQGRYVSNYFSEDENDPALRVGDYFLANAQLSYEWGPVRVFGYATNIFDEFEFVQKVPGGTGYVVDPREYGAGVEFRF